MAKKLKLGMKAIAERKLKVIGAGDKDVRVLIGLPKEEGPNHWACPFWFEVKGEEHPKRAAYGVDGMQALIMALEGIRTAFAKDGRSFSWLGGEGQTGFPAIIPNFFGPEFERELIQLVTQAIEKKANEIAKTKKKIGG